MIQCNSASLSLTCIPHDQAGNLQHREAWTPTRAFALSQFVYVCLPLSGGENYESITIPQHPLKYLVYDDSKDAFSKTWIYEDKGLTMFD